MTKLTRYINFEGRGSEGKRLLYVGEGFWACEECPVDSSYSRLGPSIQTAVISLDEELENPP